MLKSRTLRSKAAKGAVVISIILSAAALFFLLYGTGIGSGIPGSGHLIEALFIVVLAFAAYTLVWKHIGWLRFGARKWAIILAIVDLLFGYFYLGNWVMYAGIALAVAWIILAM